MSILDVNIEKVLEQIKNFKEDSKLGFFSKPYRVTVEGEEVIVKKYHPIDKSAFKIAELHDEYKKELSKTGLNIPETKIEIVKNKNKYILIILQEAFKKEELFRYMFEKSDLNNLLILCKLIFDDTIKFWKNKPNNKIGFHPTSRNYAVKEDELFYFDTFPPMNMPQKELNQLIIKVSPFASNFIKLFIPNKAINRVTNEYYSIVKMMSGIVGSSCRLRPEYAKEILDFSENYFKESSLSKTEINEIIREISTPPNLSVIWRLIRKLSGNTGKPNIKIN